MIDLEYAKESFRQYLSNYDRSDDKILLKEVHTFCVLDAVDLICRQENISGEDHELALLIALLHDIGRFEQLKTFHSYDDDLFDHAQFGVKVLFEEGMIRNFIEEDRYDSIIRTAIACHSLYEIPKEIEGRELFHCKIIRDADKLDNFRVKDTENTEAIFGISAEEVGLEPVSENILNAVREHRCIRRGDRTTHMDMWISYLAFIFDLNFRSSFLYIKEQDYMNRNIDRIPYGNAKTKADMEEVRSICNIYIEEKIY
ncbi:HD domain-containing protein [Blautia sp.]|uniref:HD domain-containing protein n=1 Tax=Blautia sp. TaxID=1955243 RepID=UPI002590F1DB|nr:HD domain-containing protein [Blautia sp.]